ncbi:MAG TPA: AarF/ABC1/UbiB kinase family protein [Pirellulales bacterium]|nr:AarF/ABC1/UbiB kinase family protein [Pirellulales bacterium]
MRISAIPQLYRNVNRWGEILSVLSKYGLANWVSRLDWEFAKRFFKDADGELLAQYRPEARIRLALTELGPTFIKLGQILSTRADLVGAELANELRLLQEDVRADSPEVVRATIEAELGRNIEALFAQFSDEPIASASIGQVHLARLRGGEEVVVKVQHAGIVEKVKIDLDILVGLAQMAEMVPEFAPYRPRSVVAEFQRTLRRELDFSREERHMRQFAGDFADDPTVCIPHSYPDLCTNRVLTMERLVGIRLMERERLISAGYDLEQVARRGADLYLKMIFVHGCYHADPHPGNLVVLPGNVIGLLDFGMIGRIDEPLRENIEEMFSALVEQDAVHLTSIITRIGMVPAQLDQAALSVDLSDFVSHYANQRLDEFDLGGALNEMLDIIRRYQIMLPERVAMLVKVFVMLEGTSRLLLPSFSLMEVVRPYQRQLVWRRLSPGRQARKLRRLYSEVEHLVEVLPRGLVDILHQVQTGRFDVHLDHRGLEPSVNRLVLGLLASALFLGSSMLLATKVPPLIPWPRLLEDLSLLGVVGSTLSILLGLRLWRAINKSGHLDRRK